MTPRAKVRVMHRGPPSKRSPWFVFLAERVEFHGRAGTVEIWRWPLARSGYYHGDTNTLAYTVRQKFPTMRGLTPAYISSTLHALHDAIAIV